MHVSNLVIQFVRQLVRCLSPNRSGSPFIPTLRTSGVPSFYSAGLLAIDVKSKLAELLPQLFTEILVPEAVWDEITAPGAEDAASVQLPSVSWARRVQVTAIAPEVASWDLGSGESAVLSQALLTPANSAAIIDDRAARRCAHLGLVTIGTGGLLIRAKRRGLIPSVSQRIQALREAGLWLSDDLVNLLKIQAGE